MKRTLFSIISQLDKSVLLLGPRQTGKTTLIHSLQPELSINLADEYVFQQFLLNPNELRERIGAAPRARRVFIDEIQRIPSLLNTAQALLDETKAQGHPMKFYFTGSSARKLKRGQANLLPGRVLAYELGPLTSAELGYAANTRKGLEIGFLPEPHLLEDRATAEKLLSTYSAVYLKEEIQAESLIRNLEGFVRFMSVAALHSGSLLDFSKLAKNARIPRQNTVRFFEILEDTLIAQRVDAFDEIESPERVVRKPRYFFFDPGVLNGLLGNFTASDDRKGMLFEHLVFNQLVSSAKARDVPIDIRGFHIKSPSVEIDFIVKLKNEFWALEVKATQNVHPDDAKALRALDSLFPRPHRKIIVTPEHEPRAFGSVQVWGWQHLLREMGL